MRSGSHQLAASVVVALVLGLLLVPSVGHAAVPAPTATTAVVSINRRTADPPGPLLRSTPTTTPAGRQASNPTDNAPMPTTAAAGIGVLAAPTPETSRSTG